MVCKQCWGLGVRHIQLFLVMCVFAVVHIFRVCPLLAIQLAKQEVQDSSSYHEDPFKNTITNWDETVMLKLDHVLYYVYPFALFCGGVMSIRVDNKYVLLSAVLFMSVLSFTLPAILRSRDETVGYGAVAAMRVLSGVVEGFCEPACFQIMGRWATINDYCKATILHPVGCMFGWLLINGAMFFIGKNVMGWATVFYTSGNIGVLWCVAWSTFGSKDFRTCFYISSEERTYLVTNTNELDSYGIGIRSAKRPFRWKRIFTCRDIYVVAVTDLMTEWCDSMYLIPRFMEDYYNNVCAIGQSAKSFFTMNTFFVFGVSAVFIGISASVICDYLVAQKKVLVSHQRKTCNSIGFWGAAIFFILVGYSKNVTYEKMLVLMSAFCLMIPWTGLFASFLQMAPNYAGFTYGITKSIANVPMFLVMAVSDIKASFDPDIPLEMDRDKYRTNLFLAALCFFLANFVYVSLYSTKTHEWNKGESLLLY